MPARATMTMRTTILRNTTVGTDAWGQPKSKPEFEAVATDVPCRVWFMAGREITDGTKVASVDRPGAILPVGTDVTTADKLGDVTDRQGNVIHPGPHRIESVGNRADHIAIALEVV